MSRRLPVSTEADPLVEVERLTFRYRRASEPAVSDVSLTVHPGEVVLVAGPSGCGKSTLIRAINGLIPHAYPGELSGEVRVAGRATRDLRLRDIALTVGTLLQDPGKQIVGATVEAELAFGPENIALPREEIRRRIADVADRALLRPLLGRETAHLSGGERQLLAMGGILMMKPRLFVVDEPLANLDPATADRLLRLLRELADRGEGVVIVEHRVEEALGLRPDVIVYLEEGRQAYQGSTEGFLRIADPTAVKLPFEVVLERVRSASPAGGPVLAPSPSSPRPTPATLPTPTTEPTEPPVPPRLEFRDVRAGFAELEVLHGVDARLGRTEVVAVLGPNGSGKTTLFRTAMGLLPLMAGHVLVDGVDNRERTVAQLAAVFGYVFQSPSQMLFARTVADELTFGPRNLGRPAERWPVIVDDALRRTGLRELDDILERPPLTLSFGQQKRLALAIALTLEPPTLILDEPSAGQDHRSARRFLREVLAIDGLESVYLVTHDVDLALTHADRILLFREGRVVAEGSPARVIEDERCWTESNLRVTSLMRANARARPGEDRFLDAESLARLIVAREAEGGTPQGWEGGSPVDARH